MNSLSALMLWSVLGGYVIGKRKGQPMRYALLALPVALLVYTVVIVATAILA